MDSLILIRGGGDLASGVALRLQRAGLRLLIAELPRPLAVRRKVSFAEAIYEGEVTVEEVTARRTEPDQIEAVLARNEIPVLVDPNAEILIDPRRASSWICAVVDGRLLKQAPEPLPVTPRLYIGLGPGFHAGKNCQAVVETSRSHTLGRVYWDGPPQADSGQPEGDPRRVLRAPLDGLLLAQTEIGVHLEQGQVIAEIRGSADTEALAKITSPFKGVLRGLLHPGIAVQAGMKLGDVDARDDSSACFLVSDKALAVGGGVLEALLSKPELRHVLFG